MNRLFRTTVVETSGVRTIAGGGTNASNAGQALLNLGGVSLTGDQTINGTKSFVTTENSENVVASFDANFGNPLEIVTSDEPLMQGAGSSAYAIGVGPYGFAVKYTSTLSDWGQPILVTEGGTTVVHPTATISFSQQVQVSGKNVYVQKDVKSFTGNNFTPNANEARVFEYVLTGIGGATATLNAPTNLFDGDNILIKIQQSPSGSNNLVFNSSYKFPGGVVPSLTLEGSRVDIYTILKIGSNFYSTYVKDFTS